MPFRLRRLLQSDTGNWVCHMQVSIDLFVTARQAVDLASVAEVCGPTGGQLYHYCPFLSPADDDQLYNDLRWNVQRPQVSKCATQ